MGFETEAIKKFPTISGQAAVFNGYLGSNIFDAIIDNKQREYAIIFHFDIYENLMAWGKSEERIE